LFIFNKLHKEHYIKHIKYNIHKGKTLK